MEGYSIIADAGASLLRLLRDSLVPDMVSDPLSIALASPHEAGDLALTLFLFNVKENGEARRTGMQDMGGVLQYPPQALDLYYMMTAHARGSIGTKTMDEHRILGRAMQILHDNAMLRPPYLEGALAESGAPLRLSLVSMEGEDLVKLWPAREPTYKLSAVYKAGPVMLQSNRTKPVTRVTERHVVMKEK